MVNALASVVRSGDPVLSVPGRREQQKAAQLWSEKASECEVADKSATPPICQKCGSSRTQTVKMLCLSMTNSASSAGVGLTDSGSLGVAGMRTDSMTALAQQFLPGPKPTGFSWFGGCLSAVGILGLFGGLLSYAESHSSSDSDGIIGAAILLVAGVVVFAFKRFQARSLHPIWVEKTVRYELGWVCLQCGHSWVPGE